MEKDKFKGKKKASFHWRHCQSYKWSWSWLEVISKSVTNIAWPTVINIHELDKIDNVPHPTFQIVP